MAVLNPKIAKRGLGIAQKTSTAAEQEFVKNELINRGQLRDFFLDKNQQGMAREFDASKIFSLAHVFLCSRRIGKTHLLCVLAIEQAIKKPGAQIKYATTTAKSAREIVLPIIREIAARLPSRVKPKFNKATNVFTFPNNSEILLHGVDKDVEGLRGAAADLFIVDEAGFIDQNLDYLIASVAVPMVVERGGRIILSSTPPRNPEHIFVTHFIAQAMHNKAFTKRVITDCPRFTQKQVEMFINEAGAADSESVRREYFCDIIKDASKSVIPEFCYASNVVETFPPLLYRPDKYVGMDVGYSDDTAIIFGYYDFTRAKVCVQKSVRLEKSTTSEIAEAITKTENELGWNPKIDRIKRYSDTDLRLVEELRRNHSLKFYVTEKTNKELIINQLRTMCRDMQIEIHQSNTDLIIQLEMGTFKISKETGKRQFARLGGNLGHLDMIDALLYMIRNIDRNRNPLPVNNSISYWNDWGTQQENPQDLLRKAFNK